MKEAVCLLVYFFFSTLHVNAQQSDYGTHSQTALVNYRTGWQLIMDFGEWTKAEEAFRKAIKEDPEFLLGWVQVGRISNDPEERSTIFAMLKKKQYSLNPLDGKLLKPYLLSMEIIDLKDRNQKIPKEKVSEFYQTSLRAFSDFFNEFPDEVYVFAEYIETIHRLYGANAALDSIHSSSKTYHELPFLISYKAILEAELGLEKRAWESFDKFKASFDEEHLIPSLYFTEAKISNLSGDDKRSAKAITKTLELDPKHTLAKRLKDLLDQSGAF
jgi:tetratricopeptide (TPR) repeat protein